MKLVTALCCALWSCACIGQTPLEYSQHIVPETVRSRSEAATAWGLSDEEWVLLEQLKTKYSGLVSPRISPLEWLGIFATNPNDRERYATMLAERQLAILNAISEFESAYLQAIRSLSTEESTSQADRKRFILITSYSCENPKCKRDLNQAVAHASNGAAVDIVIREHVSGVDTRIWAANENIPQHLIRNKKITINHSHGRIINMPDGLFNTK